MNFTEYQAIDAINATAIKAGAVSMKHMRAVMTGRTKEQTPAMRLGSLVHLAILEPAKLSASTAIWQAGRRAGKDYEAFCVENEGREIITQAERDELTTFAQAVHANDLARELIAGSEHEVTLEWSAQSYGYAKARLDGVTENGDVIELKTVSRINDFGAQFARMGYDLQCGWYREGLNIAKGKRKRNVWIIVVESQPPYDVAVWRVPSNALQGGLNRAQEIASRYRVCECTGVFPGVQAESGTDLVLPPWYEGDADMSEIMPMDPSEL